MIATELPTQSKIQNPKSKIGRPHYRRTQQVYAVLNTSPPEETYDRLIEYVRQSTGKGCSRKLISKWKKLTIQDGAYPPSSPNPKSQSVSQEIFLASEVRVNTEEILVKDEPLVTETPSQSPSVQSTLDNNSVEVSESQNPQFIFEHEDEQLPNRTVSHKPSIDSPQEHLTEKAEPIKNTQSKIQNLKSKIQHTWSYVAATAIVVGIAGCGWFFSKDNSQSVIAQPATVTQTAPTPRTQKLEPRTIKIHLTLTSPQDLKVKPGDEVISGTVLSDRTTERQRLLAQKKQLEISLKKLDLPIPEITQPKPIPALSKLPPVSYQQEEANIALKQQELAEAERAIANQETKIKELEAIQNSEFKLQNVLPDSESDLIQSPKSNISQISLPQKIQENAEQNSQNQDVQNKEQTDSKYLPLTIQQSSVNSNSIHNPKTANRSLLTVIEHEKVVLEQLIAARDKAKLQLDIAKSQLITAKEQRAHAEYQRYLEETKRAIALQQQQIELERQRSIRAGQIQEREYSKAQIETKIQEIDNAIAQLSTVKAPYAGKIKKVKWTGQDNHNLTVTLTLDVDDGVKSQQLPVQKVKFKIINP